jgi:PKD repeat protein
MLKISNPILISSSILLILIGSCKKNEEPTSCFSTSFNEVKVNQTIEFTNCSESADSYNWNFGDGNFSTQANPSHLYAKGGLFRVLLTANNEGGTNVSERIITVDGSNPRKMIIHSIAISSWPETNNGQSWDNDGTSIDLLPKITDSNKYLFTSSTTHNNCQPGNTYVFDEAAGLPITAHDLSNFIYIEWYDQDATNQPFVGSLGFAPLDASYVGKENIQLISGELAVQLSVSWEY